jgi:tetratricopeptide (TPR) repeat protein
MRLIPSFIHAAGKYLLLLLLLSGAATAFSQKSKADSLERLLVTEKADTSRVQLMRQLADIISIYNPDSALRIAQNALYLSKEIKYMEGESKSLASMANAFLKVGNYPRALDLYFQKLQLEEKRDIPRNLAGTLMNIGNVYTMQEEYSKGLEYYYKADTIIRQNNVVSMKYYILLNLGDVYNRLDNSDSSYSYFSQSLKQAKELNDTDLIAASRTGLGHSYLKLKEYDQSRTSYRDAITGLQAANDDEILCEAELGLANLYQQLHKNDSAVYYANQSLAIARRGDFLSHELDAAVFLTNYYKSGKNTDSAFAYVSRVQELNDSIYSKHRIRESQVISSNEQLRQREIEENKKIAARERHQQLQLLFIGIFIPGFFLFTLLLSRIKIPTRIIKIMGVLSLLILFEYLTLLLHPYVLEFTEHTPVYEILIFVAIAAILIPAHHRIEHWLVEKLTSNKINRGGRTIRLTTKKIKIKDPSA